MTSETDNLPLGGTDNAHPPTALDHPDNLSFWEPGDEEPDTSEPEQAGTETDSEPDEAVDEGQESEEAAEEEETETEGEEAETASAPEITDDILINMNGQQLALSELKSGYMKQADYSRKTQEVANTRRDLEALSARVNNSVSAIAEFLVQQLPAQPDFALSQTNPNEYWRQKAVYDASMEQMNGFLAKAGEVKEVANTLTAEQRRDLIDSEFAQLAEAFPTTTTPEGRKSFFENASTAAKELGYTDEEIQSATDHRMFALAHYARIGLKAEQAKTKVATKVANAPPVTPQKRPQAPSKARENKEAMKRLSRTGSIHDAMRVDWD